MARSPSVSDGHKLGAVKSFPRYTVGVSGASSSWDPVSE
jgi:hypothetical protein